MYLGPTSESVLELDVPDKEKENVLVPDVVGREKLGINEEGPEPGPEPPLLKAVGGGAGNPKGSGLDLPPPVPTPVGAGGPAGGAPRFP